MDLEDAVTAGGTLVRGHQLRLRSVGKPAGRERGVKENEHHGRRRSHGSSLVGPARLSCGGVPGRNPSAGAHIPGVYPVLWPISLAGTAPTWIVVVLGIADLVIRVLAVGIIPGNRRPTTAMAWLLGIFFVPFVGLALFLLFGNFKLSSRRRAAAGVSTTRVRAGISSLADVESDYPGPEWVKSAGELNRRLGSLPMVDGNSVDLIPGYPDSIFAMTEAVRKAKKFVNAEFYIMSTDHITDELLTAMEEAAERGVEVRVLFDHIGTLRVKGYRNLLRRLRASKIQWKRMLPLLPIHGQWRRPDLRNHRKIMVVDGELAFTGSQNLIEPSYNNPKHRKAGRPRCPRAGSRAPPGRRRRDSGGGTGSCGRRGPRSAAARAPRASSGCPCW